MVKKAEWSREILKYIQLNFDSSIIKIKASYASKDGVSHAEFWNSAAFGRMIEWSREILSNPKNSFEARDGVIRPAHFRFGGQE